MAAPIRHFTEKVGLRPSILASTVTGAPAQIRLIRTSGVRPMVYELSFRIDIPASLRSLSPKRFRRGHITLSGTRVSGLVYGPRPGRRAAPGGATGPGRAIPNRARWKGRVTAKADRSERQPDWQRLIGLLGPIHAQVAGMSRRLAGSAVEGDDLFQDAVIRALGALPALRDEARFPAWFHAILLSVHRSRSRRSFWKRFLPLVSGRPGETEAVGEDGAAWDGERRQAMRVSRALASLPAERREAIVLFDLEGRTTEEIETDIRAQLEAEGLQNPDVRVSCDGDQTKVIIRANDEAADGEREFQVDLGSQGADSLSTRLHRFEVARRPGMTDAEVKADIERQMRETGLDGEVTVEEDKIQIRAERHR